MSKLYKLQLTLSDGNKIETAPFEIPPAEGGAGDGPIFEHKIILGDDTNGIDSFFTIISNKSEAYTLESLAQRLYEFIGVVSSPRPSRAANKIPSAIAFSSEGFITIDYLEIVGGKFSGSEETLPYSNFTLTDLVYAMSD